MLKICGTARCTGTTRRDIAVFRAQSMVFEHISQLMGRPFMLDISNHRLTQQENTMQKRESNSVNLHG
jgi:hypothetical protein